MTVCARIQNVHNESKAKKKKTKGEMTRQSVSLLFKIKKRKHILTLAYVQSMILGINGDLSVIIH